MKKTSRTIITSVLLAVTKAGGPHYLLKFASERTLTVNTTAAGGNASLLTLAE